MGVLTDEELEVAFQNIEHYAEHGHDMDEEPGPDEVNTEVEPEAESRSENSSEPEAEPDAEAEEDDLYDGLTDLDSDLDALYKKIKDVD